MMTAEEFKGLVEWQKIEQAILEIIKEQENLCVVSSTMGDHNRAAVAAGSCLALNGILDLPERILAEDKQMEEPKTLVGSKIFGIPRPRNQSNHF
jgi:hypothetical protein